MLLPHVLCVSYSFWIGLTRVSGTGGRQHRHLFLGSGPGLALFSFGTHAFMILFSFYNWKISLTTKKITLHCILPTGSFTTHSWFNQRKLPKFNHFLFAFAVYMVISISTFMALSTSWFLESITFNSLVCLYDFSSLKDIKKKTLATNLIRMIIPAFYLYL